MKVAIYIHSSERHEAIEAYKDWLSDEQIDEIEERNVTWLVVRENETTSTSPES